MKPEPTPRLNTIQPLTGEVGELTPKAVSRPATELFELRAAAEHSRQARKRRKSKRNPALQIRRGSVTVLIFGHKGAGHPVVCYREGAGTPRRGGTRLKLAPRIRIKFSTLTAAKTFAEEKATALANEGLRKLSFTPQDAAVYARAIDSLPPGQKLEIFVHVAAQCVRRLNGVSLDEATDYYLRQHPAGEICKTIPELAKDLLATLKQDGVGKRWERSLEGQLDKFAETFTGHLRDLQAEGFNAWLRSLGGSAKTRLNYRGAVFQLVNFAKRSGALAKDWDEMDRVPRPEVKPVKIKILTPEEMVRLLAGSLPNMVPFIALNGFAGIRHEEMNGEKSLLDWRDIHFDEKLIYVPSDVAKTVDRIVPMSDNLIAWLMPYARRNGPICELVKTSAAICRAKERAGIPAGKNETRNCLRKSFISYRLAVVKNIAQVAEEAGNSPAKIKSNYRRPIPEAEGKRWFDIWPTTAGILQLQFKLK